MKVDANEPAPEVRVIGADLAKYVGGYGNSAVVFEIEQRGDKLVGKTSEREYDLTVRSATTFQPHRERRLFERRHHLDVRVQPNEYFRRDPR